jgi:hypothetical protein
MLMKSAADVSFAYEVKAVGEHAMSAHVGGACGDGDGTSKYGVPCLAAKCEGCATTGIGGAIQGNGGGETNGGAIESAAREHAIAASVGSTNVEGDVESSCDTLESTVEHEYYAP